MGKFMRRVVGVAAICAAGVYVYNNVLDDDTKETIQNSFTTAYETARAVVDKALTELGQIIEEDPDLARVRDELKQQWANLGY